MSFGRRKAKGDRIEAATREDASDTRYGVALDSLYLVWFEGLCGDEDGALERASCDVDAIDEEGMKVNVELER